MSNKGLYFYKLISKYPEDQTLNCKLSINQIDSNFEVLKDNDIKIAEFFRDEKTLVLTKNNGEKIIAELNRVPYDLNVVTGCGESGLSMTIKYDGEDGEKEFKLSNILTYDNLKSVIGSDILTKVITDNSLNGNGTISSPLGLAGTEKTGTYAPVIGVIDTTNGEKLPDVAKLGTRYITKEYVNDYGFLYNGYGVGEISSKLETDGRGWRVPSKADWDALLNSIEPCNARNHGSAQCHIELGKVAGKYLKSECGWVGQDDCECAKTKPFSCSYDLVDTNGVDFNGSNDVPSEKLDSCVGVDKYGMAVLPSGKANANTMGTLSPSAFGESSYFWTTTHVHDDLGQDVYVKKFDWNKCGIYQVAECLEPYYSVRLVKDFDGSNYFGTVDFDGITYDTILFPESGQIWLASNYGGKENIDEKNYTVVNDGSVLEKRTEFYINEWNGKYWERKAMNEADTVVVENPCFDQSSGKTIEVCWLDSEGIEKCVLVDVPKIEQSNIEYRVFTEDGGCNKVLINTDDLVTERVLMTVLPIVYKESEEIKEEIAKINCIIGDGFSCSTGETITEKFDKEREERETSDIVLEEALSAETEARITVDEALLEALTSEVSARTDADEEIKEALSAETEARIEADEVLQSEIEELSGKSESAQTELWEALSAETEARIEADENEEARAISAETALDEKIDEESDRAQEREDEIDLKLDEEIERAKETEDEISGLTIDTSIEYTMSASASTENLILKSKDGNEDHFVKIKFDGNFGTISW